MDSIIMALKAYKTKKTGEPRSDNTIKLYVSLLNSLYNKLGNSSPLKDLNFLLKTEKITEVLKSLAIGSQKNYYSACIAGLEVHTNIYNKKEADEAMKYYKDMISLIFDILSKKPSLVKTEKQDKNWTTVKELQKVMVAYKKELSRRGTFKKNKDDLTQIEHDLLKKWLITCLYVVDPKNNPPLRSDYSPMKIITKKLYDGLDAEALRENYLVIVSRNSKFFSLGNYKTSNKYGVKQIKVFPKLNTALNLYLGIYKGKYLFLNKSNKIPLTPNAFGKMVTRAFESTGKNISINLIRHIVITEFNPPTGPSAEEKDVLASKMCHSTGMQNDYIKKD
tara:strand:- start:988 stop:1992 length:1005 start_codon:yes stop_codon:yes gene_type:complete